MAPTAEPPLTLDMYAMRDMCAPAVPTDAPSPRSVHKSVLKIQRSIPLFNTARTSTRIVSDRSMENISNRVDGMSVAPGGRLRYTLARGPLALERAVERENVGNEAEISRGRDRHNTNEPASASALTDELTAYSDNALANGRELSPLTEAEVSDSEHATESDRDEDHDDTKEDSDDNEDDDASVVEVSPPKANKGKERASDEATDEASEHSDSESSEFNDEQSDSSSTTDSDNDSAYVPQNPSARELRHTSARTTRQDSVASSKLPDAGTSEDKKAARDAADAQVAKDLARRIGSIWKRLNVEDPRGQADEHEAPLPETIWTNVEWVPHIQKMEGRTPCPFEGCDHAFCIKREKVVDHFIKYHFDDPQFASKQYVLLWLALPAHVRLAETSKDTRFPCIFQGSTLGNRGCNGAHVADGYGRHLCEVHRWEGLVNFRCTECDTSFWARDMSEQALRSAHLKNCKYYKEVVTGSKSSKKSKKREASSDAEDDADEGPSTRRNKRKASDAEDVDDVGEGPSTRRNKRTRL